MGARWAPSVMTPEQKGSLREGGRPVAPLLRDRLGDAVEEEGTKRLPKRDEH